METLSVKGPFTMGDITLFAIERTWFQIAKGRSGLWLNGSKQAYAIIIRDANDKRAFDIDSRELDITAVIKKIPELGELLSQA